MNELRQQLVHLLHVKCSLAVWIFELPFVFWQKRAGGIEIVFLCLVIKRQRVELAAQGLVIPKLAPLCAKVRAFVFDAQVLMNRSFSLRECDF